MKKNLIALLFFVIVGGAIAGGIYYYKTKVPTVNSQGSQNQNPTQDINKNQEVNPDLNEIKQNSVDVSDLKTYRNEELGFEFQYPPQYTFVTKTKDWDEEKKQNQALEYYAGSYFAGTLSFNNRDIFYLKLLSNDYKEGMGRGRGFSDYNGYTFNEQENKYYLNWLGNNSEEATGSVKKIVIGGKEGIIIDYNEFLKTRDCFAGYPHPYLAFLIKTGWTKYPVLNISFSDILVTDPKKCIFTKPLPDDEAIKIIESFKFTK